MSEERMETTQMPIEVQNDAEPDQVFSPREKGQGPHPIQSLVEERIRNEAITQGIAADLQAMGEKYGLQMMIAVYPTEDGSTRVIGVGDPSNPLKHLVMHHLVAEIKEAIGRADNQIVAELRKVKADMRRQQDGQSQSPFLAAGEDPTEAGM